MKLTILGALVGGAAITAGAAHEVFQWPNVLAWALVSIYAVVQMAVIHSLTRHRSKP